MQKKIEININKDEFPQKYYFSNKKIKKSIASTCSQNDKDVRIFLV